MLRCLGLRASGVAAAQAAPAWPSGAPLGPVSSGRCCPPRSRRPWPGPWPGPWPYPFEPHVQRLSTSFSMLFAAHLGRGHRNALALEMASISHNSPGAFPRCWRCRRPSPLLWPFCRIRVKGAGSSKSSFKGICSKSLLPLRLFAFLLPSSRPIPPFFVAFLRLSQG